MNKDKKSAFYWMSISAIVVFFIGLVVYLTTITPSVQGDGHEYIMQTVAFQNHLSFGITPEDFEQTKTQFFNNQDGLYNTYTNPIAMFCDEQGCSYSNHFGAYSAIVTVVKLILLRLNVYPLWAFSITNLILWMAAILVVFFFLKVNDKKKFCILILLMANPAFYYLDWVHPEIYIFAFEIIGLVFLYNKRYALSILALSVSAMQNLGVLPMAAVTGIAYICDCYDKYVQASQNRNIFRFISNYWYKILPYGLFYIPAFIPLITTYMRSGVFNRVAEVAMENKYMFHKAIDYLFDPNLGILPYEPFILVAFIILVVIGFRKFFREAILNLLGVTGILFIIAHQIQINSGMHGIMRYCVWIIPIMVFFVVLHWPSKNPKGYNSLTVVTVVESVFTAIIVSYCVWFGGAYSSVQFANWTKALIDVAPQLYNPTHGIFYSRVCGGETYYSPVPVVYTNKQGYVRKILLSKAAETDFYDESFLLIDEEGNQINKDTLKRYTIDEGDYTYYNFKGKTQLIKTCLDKFSLGDEIDTIYFYSDQYNADIFASKGLSFKEDWGSWTDGQELVILFRSATSAPFIGIQMDICSTFYHPQAVTVLMNGAEVYQDVIEGNAEIEFAFGNPGTDIIELTFLLPDAIAPSDIMDSEDTRKLGLGLLTMKVTEAEYEISKLSEDGIIHFNSLDYNANLFVVSGILSPEKEATWTVGDKVIALFALNERLDSETIHVSFDVESVMDEHQEISISINGENMFSGTVSSGENAISFDMPYPKDGKAYMIVNIPNAISFSASDNSNDTDALCLMIRNIKFSENH